MLNTIEQKLSAIRAINEEKDSVDKAVSFASNNLHPSSPVYLDWKDNNNTTFRILIPDGAKSEIFKSVLSAYQARQKELIAQATELMK
jgi:hypothetical protein